MNGWWSVLIGVLWTLGYGLGYLVGRLVERNIWEKGKPWMSR